MPGAQPHFPRKMGYKTGWRSSKIFQRFFPGKYNYNRMHFRSALLIILLICGCAGESAGPACDYGVELFTLGCYTPESESLWICNGNVDSNLISGYFHLELKSEEVLAFCGDGLELNTGNTLHDSMAPALTSSGFNCFFSHENELGNEFDWIWYEDDSRLQLIWRPSSSTDKYASLHIQGARSIVYYSETPPKCD